MAGIEAPIVANQTLAAVSAIFSWAVREEILPANPCKLVTATLTQSRERVLADSEVPLFWKAFDDAGLVVGSALKAILLSGQRPGEVAHMRREHIKDGWWKMPGEPVPRWAGPGTKNAQAHRVWFPTSVQALMAELGDAATGFVFAGPRGRAARGLDAAMRSICTKLGVEPVTPHDLRRTFSTDRDRTWLRSRRPEPHHNHREGGIAAVYDRHGYAEENKRVMEERRRASCPWPRGRRTKRWCRCGVNFSVTRIGLQKSARPPTHARLDDHCARFWPRCDEQDLKPHRGRHQRRVRSARVRRREQARHGNRGVQDHELGRGGRRVQGHSFRGALGVTCARATSCDRYAARR